MEKPEIKDAVREVLEEFGLVSPEMELKEVIKQVGKYRYEKAVKAGIIKRIKKEGNKNTAVRINRKEFTEALQAGKI